MRSLFNSRNQDEKMDHEEVAIKAEQMTDELEATVKQIAQSFDDFGTRWHDAGKILLAARLMGILQAVLDDARSVHGVKVQRILGNT